MPPPNKKPKFPIPPLKSFLKDPVELPARGGIPTQYHVFERDSAQAIRAALAARRPLLVRGEPGVGKTQLAAAAAKVLQRPLVTRVVDSRTESRDLLWTFDAVMRLADAQAASLFPTFKKPDGSKLDDSAPPLSMKELLRKELDVADYVRPGPLWWGFDWKSAEDQARRSGTTIATPEAGESPKNGRVVLIDEIDKADTDVPNGLLEALGAGQFSPQGQAVPVRIVEPFPLVVITTNEERVLPAAFIRRCFVLHLSLPEKQSELEELLVKRAKVHFPGFAEEDDSLFKQAAKLIADERAIMRQRFVKPLPGQAEFLDLLRSVIELGETDGKPADLLGEISQYVLKKQESPSA